MKEKSFKFLMIVVVACFLLSVIPVSAVRSTEQSVGGSLTRGGRFTVTITGLPNSSYYLWIPHTSSMTGEPRDQPPVIADYQTNVANDPDNGPWPIGSYQYNNGGGETIRDDIAPSTADMPNTRYYALVTTDHSGLATVEFLTSVNTGLRSYSVKVENPQSVDSDNLLVTIRVYSRKAPAPIEIFTTPETTPVAALPTPTASLPPVTTLLPVTSPEPMHTASPAQVPTQKAPAGIGTGILAAVVILFLVRKH
jgi:hypothetical protein